MLAVDTNVLVHAANPQSPFHPKCAQLVESCRLQSAPWYATWPICHEFMRVMTHANVLARPWSLPQAWDFLEALLDAPSFSLMVPTERTRSIAAEVFAEMPHLAGNILHDAHTVVLMREYGIRRLYSRDTDFHRFAFVEVIDPMILP